MAQGKKSFIVYCDLIHKIDHLTNEEKGILLQHILEYVNDMNPVIEDRVLLGVWKGIELQLKSDLKLWEKKQDQRSRAGKKSAEARKQKKNERPLTSVESRSTNSTVNVTGNVTVNDTDIVSTTETIKQIEVVYEDFVDEIRKGHHQQWAEQTYMQLKLKKGTLTTLIKEFKSHLIRIAKAHPNISEFKKHLNNWLNSQDSLGKLKPYKNRKSVGAI